jgi:hypothetical protein
MDCSWNLRDVLINVVTAFNIQDRGRLFEVITPAFWINGNHGCAWDYIVAQLGCLARSPKEIPFNLLKDTYLTSCGIIICKLYKISISFVQPCFLLRHVGPF